MMNSIASVLILSLICGTFALDTDYSPVLFFKNKENTKVYPKGIISSTTPMSEHDFVKDVGEQPADQKIVFLVTEDLSPEDLSIKNEHHERGFQNLATNVAIVKYMPYVKSAVQNKITMGQKQYALTTTNELEPEPSPDARIIIVSMPTCDDEEDRYHCMGRLDRASYALSQSEKYKDALFILTSEMNSHLAEVHSRKARQAADAQAPVADKGNVYKSKNSIVYFQGLKEQLRNGNTNDVQVTGVTTTKVSDEEISIDFKGTHPIVLKFQLLQEYAVLNSSQSTMDGKPLMLDIDVYMPEEFSYACVSSIFFRIDTKDSKEATDVIGVYFENLQIQLNFTNNDADMTQFGDAYDCVGFTSPAIWSGLFITFLLLTIVSTGITWIMDIKSMDKFDDPKGKTISISASE